MPKIKEIINSLNPFKPKEEKPVEEFDCPRCGKIKRVVVVNFKQTDLATNNGKYCAKCYYEDKLSRTPKVAELGEIKNVEI